MEVIVIGAGLAGSEAAWQLAKRGVKVKLYEKKRVARHSAFKTDDFAELICSNSLRSNNIENAVGLLKEEMRHLDSLIMEAADKNAIDAGSSLACDREGFSSYITEKLRSHPNIEVFDEEVKKIDIDKPTIVAAGPLCEGSLSEALAELCDKRYLYFYDAISPIIEKDSIDMSKAYYKSRYDKRGKETLLFGPMKPVGLEYEGKRPYAVCQLRQDNAIKTLYNIVGFQTHLTFGAQKEVLSKIPALKNAHIVRYGVMHRNTYIDAPRVLDAHYQMIRHPNVFVVGQIAGVEGYVESAASGLYGALSMAQYLKGAEIKELGQDTIIGSMAHYISNPTIAKLTPMNANFGIFRTDEPYTKKDKRQVFVRVALANIDTYRKAIDG